MDNDLLEQLFWPHVDIQGPGRCWPWVGPTNQERKGQRRGVLWIVGHERAIYAPRVRLMLAGYTLGRWDFACHTCDNPLCVNLEHLYVGSPQSNRDDAKARGRLNSKDGHPPFKLTVEQVLYIREECAKGIRGTQARLARELGVTPSMITMIKQRKARTTLWSEQEPA